MKARAILLGGAIAGALDLLYAFVVLGARGISPLRTLQSIATGLLGSAAYRGGLATALLGLALHFSICFAGAAVYLAISRRVAWSSRHTIVAGLLFGIGFYAVMTFIVLPLSAFPHPRRYDVETVLSALLVHTLLVGQPIAWSARLARGAVEPAP